MMPTCPLSWIERPTSASLSSSSSPSNVMRGAVEEPQYPSRDFLPRRDSYFLIKQRTCTSSQKNECTIVTLSWRCLQLDACSYGVLPRLSCYCRWFARFGIVKTRMKRLFLASCGQVCTKHSCCINFLLFLQQTRRRQK